jgi:hypothetical protein
MTIGHLIVSLLSALRRSFGRPPFRAFSSHEWKSAQVVGKSNAEDLLDWLDAHGHAPRELAVLSDTNFEVRWR